MGFVKEPPSGLFWGHKMQPMSSGVTVYTSPYRNQGPAPYQRGLQGQETADLWGN